MVGFAFGLGGVEEVRKKNLQKKTIRQQEGEGEREEEHQYIF